MQIKDMKKIALYILLVFAAVSCYKDAEYDQTLGTLMEYNILSESGGSTQVAVFSNTKWTVEMDRQVSWASIDRLQGYKTGYLVFDFDVNYGRSRRLNLIFKAGGETRTMCMFQKARIAADDDCELTLGGSPTVNVAAAGGNQEIAFSTNLVYDLADMFLTVTDPVSGAAIETPWITLKKVELDKVTLEIGQNGTGASRSADICISHTDGGVVQKSDDKVYDSVNGDTISSNTITVVQS